MIGNNIYYRPIQYLGSKTRAIDTIITECNRLYSPGEYVLDLFSGSSIVSQAFYKSGKTVIANDTMHFCCDISSCMLNIERKKNSISLISEGLSSFRNFKLAHEFTSPFYGYIDEEATLLHSHDLLGLQKLYSSLPQVGNEDCLPTNQITYIRTHEGESAIGKPLLVTNFYAGTYFGINQSLQLDTIRTFIEDFNNHHHDKWVYTVFLTALYNTLSIIVHSAGKHFAQPIAITELNAEKITNRRLFENRNHNVYEVFVECIKNIVTYLEDYNANLNCLSIGEDISVSGFTDVIGGKNVSVVYADPPYTAQQYSRFYHIPEILHSYVYPKLQIHKGHTTQGIYPDNKFKSDFCSKVKAKAAFSNMFNIVRQLNAHLMLSYSESKKVDTGNERMVTMEDILLIAQKHIPNYISRQIDFDFEYKQLNKKNKVVEDKEDKEFLIIFEKK